MFHEVLPGVSMRDRLRTPSWWSTHHCGRTGSPNILILLGDDTIRLHLDHGVVRLTPHIDRLHVMVCGSIASRQCCDVCTVSTGIFSGQCAWRTGAMPNHSKSAAGTKVCHIICSHLVTCWLAREKTYRTTDAYPFDDLGDLAKDRMQMPTP